jgi:pyruvate/2-oxoglutarate dehydrogenase complex dihydrolipoamide dehydrogenase (E3) component
MAMNALDAVVLVIGFGKGGKTAAAQLGRLGERVLVEQSDRMYEGTCPNVGYVPSKALVHRSGKHRQSGSTPGSSAGSSAQPHPAKRRNDPGEPLLVCRPHSSLG